MRILYVLFCIGIAFAAPSVPDSGLCEVCHLLVGEVQDLLTTGQTQSTLSSYVRSTCSKLPSEEKDVCNRFLKEYSGVLFHRLVKDLQPHEVCQKLTDVCPSYHEQQGVQLLEEADDPTANPLECELCKLAVLGIDKLIKENRSSAAINNTLEKFCDGLPDQLKDVCRQIEPAILKGLTQGFDPDVACKFATLCTAEENEVTHIPCDVCYTIMDAIGIKDTESICAKQTTCIQESEADRKQKPAKPEVDDTLECQICKFAVQAIDTLVGENRSVAAINSTLINLCNSLPGELKDSCLNVEPDILKAVIGGIDPSKACDFLKICNDEKKVPLHSQFIPCDVCKEALEAVAGEKGVQICYTFKDVCGLEELQVEEKHVTTPVCELCQFLVKSVDDLVQNDRSPDSVEEYLDFVCTPLPDEAKPFCMNHRNNIIEQVLNGVMNPKQNCEDIDVCKEYERDIFMVEEKEEERVTEDARCELCKFVVQLLDETLESNTTIDKINATLFEICNALPDTYKQLCVSLVPQIEDAVMAGLPPTNTCIAASFCTSTSPLVSIEELKCEACSRLIESLPEQEAMKVKINVCSDACRTRSRRSADDESSLRYTMKELTQKIDNLKGVTECELCHIFIRTLDGLVGENASIETVNKTVTEICTRLTGIQLQTICLQEAPVLVKLLKDGIDPDKTCKTAKLCTEVKIMKRSVTEKKIEDIKETVINQMDEELLSMIEQKAPKNVGDLACDVCEGVVELLDQLIEENATDDKINQTLYRLCSGLPEGALKDLCLQEAPAIMTAVEQGFDPQKTCELVKLCNGESKIKERGQNRKMKKQVKRIGTEVEDSALLKALISKQKARHNVGDLACDICEGVVELLDKLVEENATDNKINQTLYKLCSGLPEGALKDLCLQEAPTIMKAIEQGFDPDKTCTLAKLCTGNQRNRKIKTMKTLKLVKENMETRDVVTKENRPATSGDLENLKDLKCDVCKAIIEELDSVVKQNASIEKINETVYGLCSKLQGALQDLCLQAAPQIVNALKNGVDPSQACSAIGLCSKESGSSVPEAEDLIDNVGDIKCDICELIVQGLDEIVGKNASAQKINETIYTLCNDLTGTARTFCILIAPTVVKEVESGVDPEKACEALNLCTSSDQPQEVKGTVGDIKCDICELVIQELDSIVGQNASDEKINATIYNLCSYLTGTAKTFCLLVAPVIVKEVESGVDPEKACETLKLCTNSSMSLSKEQTNVGDLKCELCELLVHKADEALGKNASKQEINSTIYNVCNDLSGTVQTYCYLLAPAVVKAIEEGVQDPEAACKKLKLCLNEAPVRNIISDVRKDLFDCEICRRSLEAAFDDISGNYMKVERNLLKLCHNLPVVFRKPCEKLVQKDQGRFFKMVLANYTPTSLCEMAECQEHNGRLKNHSFKN